MNRTPSLVVALIAFAIGSQFLTSAPLGISAAHAQSQKPAPQETVRSEMAKPLQAAQELTKAGKHQEALAKIAEADAVQNKTPFETFMIDRMRGPVALMAGDESLALKSLENVVASDYLPAADKTNFRSVLASLYFKAKDYAKAIDASSQYLREGGTDPKIRMLMIQSYFMNNDFARAAQELRADIQAAEKAGQKPTDEQLQFFLSAVVKQKDDAGYTEALEKLVTYYPKKEYWIELLNQVFTKPSYSERLVLDGYRFKFNAGLLSRPIEYMEMAELASRAGYPAEAKKVLDQGFESGVLGTGADAARHKRLRDAATKSANDDLKTMAQGEAEASKKKDGTALVNIGYAYVTTGQHDKGIQLMEQGLQKGGIKRLDEARLRLGLAYLQAGKKEQAIDTFKAVNGTDGSAELARYWIMYANRPN